MKWVILIENYDSSKPIGYFANACDPVEVVYSLAKIDDKGNIIEREITISGGQHGWSGRLKEALENGFYEKREVTPERKAQYKAVSP